jgi:membrane protease YdiL (CAAX protease family)
VILAAVQAASPLPAAEIACEGILVLGGLVVLAWQTKRARATAPVGVEPWRATLLDFGIWVWVVCFAIYAGANLLRFIHPAVHGPQPTQMQVLLLASAFQLSALFAQLILLRMKRPFSPMPLNHGRLPIGRAVGDAVLAWLAAYPLLAVASLVWQTLIEVVRKMWVNLQTPPQEAVKMLAQSSRFRETALLVFFAVLVAPVTEELFFRGGLYRFLKSRLPAPVAVAAASFLFALSHFNLESFLPLFVLGWLLARLYERTGQIAAPILFHALFNLASILLILLFPNSSLSLPPTP